MFELVISPSSEVLVWASNGYVSSVEYARYTDVKPTELSPGPFTLVRMTLIVELTAEALARLEAAANARGVSVEELAAETLSHVPAVGSDFAMFVTATIAEHREILDSLAAT